jgi:hypothetical protein
MDDEGRSSSHLERVESVQSRKRGWKTELPGIIAFAAVFYGVGTGFSKLIGANNARRSTSATGGGEGDHGVPSSGGDSGHSAPEHSGGSKLHPMSRKDTVADGIVTI